MPTLYFPPKTIEKMKVLSIRESDVHDVFNYGEHNQTDTGSKKAIRKYQGYEIGIYYDRNKRTGEYVIITVWKRERR